MVSAELFSLRDRMLKISHEKSAGVITDESDHPKIEQREPLIADYVSLCPWAHLCVHQINSQKVLPMSCIIHKEGVTRALFCPQKLVESCKHYI